MYKATIILFTALLSLTTLAGGNQEGSIYKVTAVKKGDNSITSTSNEVEVFPPAALYIPNAFTPNADGLNDTFGVKGEAIKGLTMRIYNRWGEMIFESTKIDNQWDGMYMGSMVPAGSYVYELFAETQNNEAISKTGMVMLVLNN